MEIPNAFTWVEFPEVDGLGITFLDGLRGLKIMQ
jgi:hypothetical protein